MNKKGVSQVVSAVLLITLVIAMAAAFGYIYNNLLYSYEDSTEETALEEIGVKSGCEPNYALVGEGDGWSDCEASYNLYNLIKEDINLKGVRGRELEDLNDCKPNKFETETCSPKELVSLKKVDNYLEIRDQEGVLVSKLELSEGVLNLELILT